MNEIIETPEQRKEILSNLIQDSMLKIAKAADIFGEMERQGDDISYIPVSLQGVLRKISRGKMLPEVYTNFTGTLRQAISRMPLSVQKNLLKDDEEVPYMLNRVATEPVMRKVSLLDPTEIKQVFGKDCIRSPEEQVYYIVKKEQRKIDRPSRANVQVIDGEVHIKKDAILTKKEVLKLLEKL